MVLTCLAAVAAVNARGQGSLEKPPPANRPPGTVARPPKPRPAPPRPVALSILSSPGECRVYVDGEFVGMTDGQGVLRLSLRRGKRVISVRKTGHSDRSMPVVASRPSSRPLHFNLTPLLFTLRLKTSPTGAEVYLDGGYKGRSDSSGNLAVARLAYGTHRLTVKAEGFITDDRPVSLSADSSLPVNLLPDPLAVGGREIQARLKAGDVGGALAAYRRLPWGRLQEPRALSAFDAILRTLEGISDEALGRVGPHGLLTTPREAEGLHRLHAEAAVLRPDVTRLADMANFWAAKSYSLRAAREAAPQIKSDLLQKQRAALAATSAPHRLWGFWYEKGWLYFRLGDFAASEKMFATARPLHPEYTWPSYALARVGIERAEREDNQGRKASHLGLAVRELDLTIQYNRNFAQAYAARSIVYSKLGRHKDAVSDGQSAVSLNPSSAYTRYALGFALFGQKKYSLARGELEAALVLENDSLDGSARRLVQIMLERVKK